MTWTRRASRTLRVSITCIAVVVLYFAVWLPCQYALGMDGDLALAARHDLAFWRGGAGDPAGAAAAFEALLVDCLRVLGPDHPPTLTARHDLAHWREAAT